MFYVHYFTGILPIEYVQGGYVSIWRNLFLAEADSSLQGLVSIHSSTESSMKRYVNNIL